MRDEDVRRLREQLRSLQRRLRREVRAVDGLSHTCRQVLSATERAGGSTTPGQLTAELRMTSSNVAAALRALEEAGMVARRRDPGDGRRAFVDVTDRGRDLVVEHRRGRDAWLGRAMDTVLSAAEQQQVLAAGELLQRLADADPDAPA